MKINFNGVEAPKSTGTRVSKVVEPGVQELVITNVEDKTAQTGTAYVAVTLNRKDNPAEYPLVERFFATPKTLWRFQLFLAEVLNRDFNGVEIDTEALRTELIGKTNTYVVDGEEYLKMGEDGTAYTNTRSRLAYNTFVNPPAGHTHFIKKLEQANDTASNNDLPAPLATSTDSDLPF